jgi:hypothetical protein
MSPYEILAVAALVAVGGFAYRLYRSDTKSGAPKRPEGQPEQLMFGRDRNGKR